MKYKCKCCGFFTLLEEPNGSFEICPVCYWEDDALQSENPNFWGGANKVSLNEAKKNFHKFGASEKRFLKFVRKPVSDEL